MQLLLPILLQRAHRARHIGVGPLVPRDQRLDHAFPVGL
jgi:hypothetical protein